MTWERLGKGGYVGDEGYAVVRRGKRWIVQFGSYPLANFERCRDAKAYAIEDCEMMKRLSRDNPHAWVHFMGQRSTDAFYGYFNGEKVVV